MACHKNGCKHAQLPNCSAIVFYPFTCLSSSFLEELLSVSANQIKHVLKSLAEILFNVTAISTNREEMIVSKKRLVNLVYLNTDTSYMKLLSEANPSVIAVSSKYYKSSGSLLALQPPSCHGSSLNHPELSA